jgi:sarcosine oxidase
VHVGDAENPSATDGLPCLYDGPRGDEPGLYSMPTPGVGFKVGFDSPVRDLVPGDDDRTPDADLTARITARVRRDLLALTPDPLDAQVCCWTVSPDGRFVIDRIAGGRVVIACGDSGEGFKFSALMGLVLADLAEGADVDPDIATFGLARFAAGSADPREHVLGR